MTRGGCLGLSSAPGCIPGYPLPGQVESTDHPVLIPQVQVACLAKPLLSFASSVGPGTVWEGRGSCSWLLLPCRHMEARSFYTYYLRTLSGVTRGSYKLNTTVSTSNETNVSQPKHADRSDHPPPSFWGCGRPGLVWGGHVMAMGGQQAGTMPFLWETPRIVAGSLGGAD